VVKENIKVSHLQFADDTITMGNEKPKNILTMKAILRCFDLSIGLRINFSKSQIVRVTFFDEEMGNATRLLNCKILKVLFTYLGIPVGCNPNKASTWTPALEQIHKILSQWKGKQLSFAGRLSSQICPFLSLSILFIFFQGTKEDLRYYYLYTEREYHWGTLGMRGSWHGSSGEMCSN